MTYIKIAFTLGEQGEGYQEVDETNTVVRLTDLDGNTLTIPADTEYSVTDANPTKPIWGG